MYVEGQSAHLRTKLSKRLMKDGTFFLRLHLKCLGRKLMTVVLELILEHVKRKQAIQKDLAYNLAHSGEDSFSFQICAVSSKVTKQGAGTM